MSSRPRLSDDAALRLAFDWSLETVASYVSLGVCGESEVEGAMGRGAMRTWGRTARVSGSFCHWALN